MLDEPFAGLDAPAQRALNGVLADLQATGCTIVISTHDLAGLLAGDGKGTNVKADTSRAKIVTTIVDEGEALTSAPSTLEGSVEVVVVTDIDGDGAVSLVDISSFMANWASKDRTFDFNNDGQMTFRDFSIILFDYFAK